MLKFGKGKPGGEGVRRERGRKEEGKKVGGVKEGSSG